MATALLVLFLAGTGLVHGIDNGLGLTPQMGWNSWNHFGCNINETIIKDAATMLASTGLHSLGYNYVNIDDCWAVHDSRGSTGQLVPDPEKFPSGISGVAEYVHSLGMKLGIYSDAGTNTCQGQPGSLGHEEIDAMTFASWGVDYLKYDNCHNENIPSPQRYVAMRDALMSVDRPIFYSLCNWGTDDTTSWAAEVGNSWRTTGDISDKWSSMVKNFKLNAAHPEIAGPGGWNDPDMLEVGNGGMTTEEYQTHFTLWSLVKAPLIIGCDLTKMTNDTLTVLSNSEIIALNQDPLGKQGTCKQNCEWEKTIVRPQIWTVQLANGDAAVVAVNFDDYQSWEFNASLGRLGLFGSYEVRDLWEHSDLGVMTEVLPVPRIPRHGVKAYRLQPTARVLE